MKTLIAKLELSKKTDLELAEYAQDKITKITGNPSFPTPNPQLSAIQTKLNEYMAAIVQADEGTKADTQHKNDLRADLEDMLRELAQYCITASNGNASKFLSSGFDLKGEKTPVGILPAPENLILSDGEQPGEIKLDWNPVKKAKSYVVQINEDIMSEAGWSDKGVCSKSSFIADGLTRGKQYWFRVIAVSAAGMGGFSQPATRFCS